MGSERANGISFSATPHHPSAPPSIFAPQLGHQFRFQSSSFLKTQAHWLHRNPALKVLLVPNPCSSTSTQSHSSHRPFRTGSTSAAGASRTIFSTQVITQSRHQSQSRSQPCSLHGAQYLFATPSMNASRTMQLFIAALLNPSAAAITIILIALQAARRRF